MLYACAKDLFCREGFENLSNTTVSYCLAFDDMLSSSGYMYAAVNETRLLCRYHFLCTRMNLHSLKKASLIY